MPGVAIGVSLVPPLSAAGMLFYFGEYGYAWEAALLYLSNLAAIVLSASVVFYALGIRPEMRSQGYTARVGLGATAAFIAVAILAIDLFYVTVQRFQEARDEERVAEVVQTWIGDRPVEVVDVDVSAHAGKRIVDLRLIFDVPWRFISEAAAPIDKVSEELRMKDLAGPLVQVLGQDIDIVWRAKTRYIGHLDVSTGETIEAPKGVR